jgi:hypothetical protein
MAGDGRRWQETAGKARRRQAREPTEGAATSLSDSGAPDYKDSLIDLTE